MEVTGLFEVLVEGKSLGGGFVAVGTELAGGFWSLGFHVVTIGDLPVKRQLKIGLRFGKRSSSRRLAGRPRVRGELAQRLGFAGTSPFKFGQISFNPYLEKVI